jgi:hypothetical protein
LFHAGERHLDDTINLLSNKFKKWPPEKYGETSPGCNCT